MDKELAYKWAAELEAHPEIQGRNYLESHFVKGRTRRCCLGVLARMCDVPEDAIDSSEHVTQFYGVDGVLPLEIMNNVGMYSELGTFEDGYGEIHHLTTLNDEGLTFPQIADIIRYFYKEL